MVSIGELRMSKLQRQTLTNTLPTAANSLNLSASTMPSIRDLVNSSLEQAGINAPPAMDPPPKKPTKKVKKAKSKDEAYRLSEEDKTLALMQHRGISSEVYSPMSPLKAICTADPKKPASDVIKYLKSIVATFDDSFELKLD